VFTFIIQLLDWSSYGQPHLFVLFFFWVWFIWLSKAIPALLYRPYSAPYTATTSVIIPVVDEPADLFDQVLARITAQHPTEVLVVINGERNEELEQVCRRFAPLVEYLWTPVSGKRNALRIGIEQAHGEICLLVDSDTVWTPGVLAEIVKPFRDPSIGGVTSHQQVLQPERNWLTRFADWMEEIRTTYSMPSQSVFGQVGCLPGRTIAFRTSILRRALPDFVAETFLGVHIEVSDDRALTNYMLRYGYRTVYQRTSVVYTDAPSELGRFIRQQYRWAKGSQYNTLKMWPWMVRHAPLLCLHFSADILTPFFLVGALVNTVWRIVSESAQIPIIHGTPLASVWLQVALACVGAMLSIGVRQIPHFARSPRDAFLLPVFVVALTLIMTPIRIWGFITMGVDAGWGTRAGSYRGTRLRTAAAKPTGDPRPAASPRPKPAPHSHGQRLIPASIGLILVVVMLVVGPFLEGHDRRPAGAVIRRVPDSGLSFGLYVKDSSFLELASAEQALGRKADIFLDFSLLGSPFNAERTARLIQSGYTVVLTLEFWEGSNPDDRYNLAAIASGALDDEIDRWARDLRAFGKPVVLRPLQEFNGDWYPWSVDSGTNQPNQFVPAWRHIVDRFRADGASNVQFELCFSRFDADAVERDIGADENALQDSGWRVFWPGDDYVDIVGLDVFNWPRDDTHRWQSFDELFADSYNRLVELTNKPIWIQELATTGVGGDRAAWIEAAFQGIRTNYPRVTSVTWFNYSPLPGRDWAFGASAESRAALAVAVNPAGGGRTAPGGPGLGQLLIMAGLALLAAAGLATAALLRSRVGAGPPGKFPSTPVADRYGSRPPNRGEATRAR
jgi:hyaluronan synthase